MRTQGQFLVQVLTERREAMRKRTSAGLAAVDALEPGAMLVLLAVAAAALSWSHGVVGLSFAVWLLRCLPATPLARQNLLHERVVSEQALRHFQAVY